MIEEGFQQSQNTLKKRFEKLLGLFFRVFLPDLFPVDRAAVVGTERDEFAIRRRIVDAAPLDTLDIVVVPVHEMHRADEERVPVEFPQRIKILANQRLSDQLPELGRTPFLAFLERCVEFFDSLKQRCILVDGATFLELV